MKKAWLNKELRMEGGIFLIRLTLETLQNEIQMWRSRKAELQKQNSCFSFPSHFPFIQRDHQNDCPISLLWTQQKTSENASSNQKYHPTFYPSPLFSTPRTKKLYRERNRYCLLTPISSIATCASSACHRFCSLPGVWFPESRMSSDNFFPT